MRQVSAWPRGSCVPSCPTDPVTGFPALLRAVVALPVRGQRPCGAPRPGSLWGVPVSGWVPVAGGVSMAGGEHHPLPGRSGFGGSMSLLREPRLVLGGTWVPGGGPWHCPVPPPSPLPLSHLTPSFCTLPPLPPLHLGGMIKNQAFVLLRSPGGSAPGQAGASGAGMASPPRHGLGGLTCPLAAPPPSASPQAGASKGLSRERRGGLRVRLIISNCSPSLSSH